MRRLLLLLVAVTACERSPRIDAFAPAPAPGGRSFVLEIRGEHFGTSPTVRTAPALATVVKSAGDERIELEIPATKRGRYAVIVERDGKKSEPTEFEVANTKPALELATPHLVRRGRTLRLPFQRTDFDGDAVAISVESQLEVTVDGDELVVKTATDGAHTLRVHADDDRDRTTVEVALEVATDLPAPKLRAPARPIEGNVRVRQRVSGENLSEDVEFVYDGTGVTGRVVSRDLAEVVLPPRPRGRYPLVVRRDGAEAPAVDVEVGNSKPVVDAVEIEIAEQETARIPVRASDPDGDPTVALAIDLWPGAYFDPKTDEVVFTPDFIQGGKTFRGTLVARDRTATGTATVTVTVRDSIRPPAPKIIETTEADDHRRFAARQTTDDFLDPTGRDYEVRLVVPREGDDLPLRVYLHPFGEHPYRGSGRGDQFCVYPDDPDDTYWYGRLDRRGSPKPFTIRRVLHLVEWLLETQPRIDPERVYVHGVSMGGAGAITVGALHARHFAFAEGLIGQLVPKRHRPQRVRQLSGLWGPPSKFWDTADVPRLLVESYEAQNQFYFTRHGKDDPVIHFGAVLFESPLVGLSWYGALQRERAGHYVVWDEGSHGPPDPELGKDWWVDGWDRAFDATTRLRRNRAFVAFSRSTLDDDPGSAKGDGTRPFHVDLGYSGKLEVVGDQGWGGDRAGAFNRYLRWDGSKLIDELDRFVVPLRSAKPATVDVTPRRVRRFVLRPDEAVRYRFGAQTGTANADARGRVTVRLSVTTDWQPLELVRVR